MVQEHNYDVQKDLFLLTYSMNVDSLVSSKYQAHHHEN